MKFEELTALKEIEGQRVCHVSKAVNPDGFQKVRNGHAIVTNYQNKSVTFFFGDDGPRASFKAYTGIGALLFDDEIADNILSEHETDPKEGYDGDIGAQPENSDCLTESSGDLSGPQ